MSDYSVTLPVPDHIYERARQIAETTNEPIETVLIRQLEEAFAEPLPTLPPDEQSELDALDQLSDDALWTIAREQMPPDKQARQRVLMDKNAQGTITSPEQEELARLVQQGQRLMLRKAQAAALLTERGHRITPQDMSTPDE